MSFVVLSHAVILEGRDVFGPAHNVVEHLSAEGYPTDLVLHSLNRSGETIHRSYRSAALVDERRFTVRGRSGELRENVRLLRRINPTVAIAVDPLNYFGLWLASLRRPKPLSVYYTADYATRRFSNPMANAAYHRLDRSALRSADVKWSVSHAIFDLRAAQGVPERDSRVIPNAPPYDGDAVIPWLERDEESLVCVGMFDQLLDWELLFDGVALALSRRPELTLHLVGDGPDAKLLRDRVAANGLQRIVRFHGLVPHHDAVAIVAKCRVGLALYTSQASWNAYRDSLKVREYFSRGLPVISAPTHPLARDLADRGAGVLVTTPAEVAEAIDRLLQPDAGAKAAEAALDLALEADRARVLSSALNDTRERLSHRRWS